MQPGHGDRPNVIAFPPLIYAVPLLAGLLLSWIAPANFALGAWGQWLGWPLLILGGLLAVWGERSMKRAGTNVNPKLPATALVRAGPFRFTRNPLYLSLNCVYLGAGLIANALWALLAFPFLVALVHHGVILREEAYLERRFGEAYREYKAEVRRWI